MAHLHNHIRPMQITDFQRLEAFEEQVHRARELFLAATHHPRRPEMMRILEAAEATLEIARRRVGLDEERCEPQPWWVNWQARRSQIQL